MDSQSVDSLDFSNPFFLFEIGEVCATCTTHLLADNSYSLDTIIDATANINLFQVLEFHFKFEENGPSNMCKECFLKTLLVYKFYQQCQNSVMLFSKYMECQKQCASLYEINVDMSDANSTTLDQQDETLTTTAEEICIDGNTVVESMEHLNKDECFEEGTNCNNIDSNQENIPPNSEILSKCSNIEQQTNKSGTFEENNVSKATKKLYKCTYCDAVYVLYASFKFHTNIHEQRFVCSYCGKAIESKFALRIHERIHTGERPFVCGKCGKRFLSNGALKKHLVSHSEKGCEFCEKTFKTRYLLQRHTQIHKEIKPHKCTECDVSFEQAFLLKRHLQKHEKVAVMDENEECVTLDSKSSSQDEETNQQTRESNILEQF